MHTIIAISDMHITYLRKIASSLLPVMTSLHDYISSDATFTNGCDVAAPHAQRGAMEGAAALDLSVLFYFLNKSEISNSYCRVMTRFGIIPCEKISNDFQF